MGLTPVYGHEDVRGVLVAAVRAGTLAQSLLFHGPGGVGKQRVGLWLAQQIMCESPAPDGLACGRCQSCRMVPRLEHPDVHWFFPLPRPDAATPEKLREKLEEARGAELASRRADPFHVPAYDRAPAYFMGTIQNLQRFASVRPAMGSRGSLSVLPVAGSGRSSAQTHCGRSFMGCGMRATWAGLRT